MSQKPDLVWALDLLTEAEDVLRRLEPTILKNNDKILAGVRQSIDAIRRALPSTWDDSGKPSVTCEECGATTDLGPEARPLCGCSRSLWMVVEP